MQIDSQTEAASIDSLAEPADDAPTVGETLAEARERLGLSEKDVADRLHITMHYVRALESNSYEKLPGAVFAKGYIRSYAELLGLQSKDLLARYDEHTSQQRADIEEATRIKARRRSKDRNRPIVIVSAIVFVGGFLALWLVNSYLMEEPAPSATVAADASTAPPAAPASSPARQQQTQPQLSLEVEPLQRVAAVETSVTDSMAATPIISTALPETNEEVIDAAAAEPQEALAAEEPSPQNLQELAALLQPPSAEPAAQPAASTARAPRIIAIEAQGDDVLRISFTGESWVEVNDSESEQIYRDIREAGDVLEITGSAPFSILLGDAPFTHMSLNGDEIDLTSNIRIDNSARLTVGL